MPQDTQSDMRNIANLACFSTSLNCLLSDLVEYSADGIAVAPNLIYTQGMLANAYFFGHPAWATQYLKRSHTDSFWKSRWQQVIPCWDNKIVVDIGCGPGNVYASLGGHPALVIGVDISLEALKIARSIGYMPLLADAQNLPLNSGCADIVTMNATVHHCDDMAKALQEAARLVKPGGLLVTDLDPQASAWRFKGLGTVVSKIRTRLPLCRSSKFLRYRSFTKIAMRAATEIHNSKPGDGVSLDLYNRVLQPLGFQVNLYPHNHYIGAEALLGNCGQAPLDIRLAQMFSGIDPGQKEAAQSVMCVAQRSAHL